jgi:hypothetical protein
MEQDKNLTASPGPAGPLVWSNEQPKVSGYYWVVGPGGHNKEIVDVQVSDVLMTMVWSTDPDDQSPFPITDYFDTCFWAGPIPEPAQPGEAASAEPSPTSSLPQVVESDPKEAGWQAGPHPFERANWPAKPGTCKHCTAKWEDHPTAQSDTQGEG